MRTRILVPLAIIGLVTGVAAPASEGAGDGARSAEPTIRYVEGFSGGLERNEPRESLITDNPGDAPRTIVTKPKGFDSTVASGSTGNFWIYSATTDLFNDVDGDGYYHYLRVRFDADTFFTDAYVYAELYLSWDGETWEQYFVTEDFLVQGSTSFDEYEVETEFVTGYPTGLYDVLIELYDADFGTFVDEFGPFQSSDFSILPIEDLDHDGLPPPPVTISHEHGGGGALSWLWLLSSATLLLWKSLREGARQGKTRRKSVSIRSARSVGGRKTPSARSA